MQWSLHPWTLQSPERISRRDALIQTGLMILLQKLTCHLKLYGLQGFSSPACHSRGLGCHGHRPLHCTQHQREFGGPSAFGDGGCPCHREVSAPPDELPAGLVPIWYASTSPTAPLPSQTALPSPSASVGPTGGSVPSPHMKTPCTIAE